MPRISRLGRNDVSEAVGEIYDRYMRQRGNVPNMFRTVAHRPQILQTMIAHMEAVLNTGTLPTKLKELVIVRTSQMNACEYCLASHSLLAKKLGYSAEQIDGLPHFEERTDLTDREKAALRLAERLTRNERPLTEPELAELKHFFDEGDGRQWFIQLLQSLQQSAGHGANGARSHGSYGTSSGGSKRAGGAVDPLDRERCWLRPGLVGRVSAGRPAGRPARGQRKSSAWPRGRGRPPFLRAGWWNRPRPGCPTPGIGRAAAG
jgi:uncharacterized peroxidase-related enzyme